MRAVTVALCDVAAWTPTTPWSFHEVAVEFNDKHKGKWTDTIANADKDDIKACRTLMGKMNQAMWANHEEVSDDCATFLNLSVTLQCVWKE